MEASQKNEKIGKCETCDDKTHLYLYDGMFMCKTCLHEIENKWIP